MNPINSIVPAICFLAMQMASAQPSPFAGEWVSYSNNGIYASPDGKCLGRSMEERRYIINSVSGAVTATYASIWHMRWLRQESHDCAYPSLPPKSAYIGNRVWLVDMTRNVDQTYEARASYRECRGDVCKLENVTDGSFTTTLVVKNAQLHDTHKDSMPLVFEPLAKAQREATLAASAFMDKWRAMPGDDTALERIRPLLSPAFNDDEQSSRLLRQYYAARLASSASYKLIEAYILAPSASGLPTNTPLLFFTIRNDQTNGQVMGETYELAYLSGSWKLLSFRF